ncbi:MAG: NUDIX domain-containing protein [Saprospiraceae bacterium]|nr:NUDIX domain-containing protein [Saprospiraceae bacterium]
MYKIYINETPLLLFDAGKGQKLPEPGPSELVMRYTGKAKFLLNYADLLEKSQRYDRVIIHSTDYEKLVADFQSNYKVLEAAGGLVYNQEQQVLMIFRRDFWDLPKGKIDPGESKEEAAVREVEEETGLKDITLGALITETYHTYRTKKGNRILKRTYWFRMDAPDQALVPQEEEDIEQAIWQDLDTFLQTSPVIYKSILEVLENRA